MSDPLKYSIQTPALRGQAGRPPHRVENRARCTDRSPTARITNPIRKQTCARVLAGGKWWVRPCRRAGRTTLGTIGTTRTTGSGGPRKLAVDCHDVPIRCRGRTGPMAPARLPLSCCEWPSALRSTGYPGRNQAENRCGVATSRVRPTSVWSDCGDCDGSRAGERACEHRSKRGFSGRFGPFFPGLR